MWKKGCLFIIIGSALTLFAADGSKRSEDSAPSQPRELQEVEGAIVGLPPSIDHKRLVLDFPVERVTLSNGMVFLLHVQRSIPLVSYHTWFRVGAKDELPGESGLAHMFEHMMFKGTKKYPNKEFDRILQANGIVNNAFTTQDYTGYYEILPSSRLELIMDMESDRMQSLNLVDEEFQKEREVVKEERRMRYDNDPSGQGWEILNRLVFQGHKYSLSVIGSMDEINRFTIEKMQKFYKKWYLPSNAVVVLVGDFDLQKTKKLIEKYYGAITSPPRPAHEAAVLPKSETQKAPIKKFEGISFPVQAAELFWGARTVKAGSDESYALDLLSAILGQGKSSRLYQQLIYKQQLALSAGSGHYTQQDSGLFYIQANAKPGVPAERLKKALEAELQQFLTAPILEEELNKAKNMVLSEYVESLTTNDGKAKVLAMNEVLLGNYGEFFKDMDRYLKVTVAEVNQVKKFLVVTDLKIVMVDQQERKQK